MSAQFDTNRLAKRYMELDASPALSTYTGVEIVVDEETSFFAGDTSGRVITIENPWGTQEQAENILNKLRGFTYKPYTASGALLDPAAEIGDGVVFNNTLYSGIFKLSRRYDSLSSADIAAPQDEEIDHEYPYETRQNRAIVRKFSAVESEFAIQSDLISAKVSKTSPEGQTAFSWELTDSAWEVQSNGTTIFRVDSTGATVRGTITATAGMIGNFNIGANAIWNNINDFYNPGGLTYGVYLGTNGIRLGRNFTVDTAGNITAANATLTGTLNVGGAYIDANTLRSGAQSAYSNGSYWGGGASWGYNYGNATQSQSYAPENFFAQNLRATRVYANTYLYAALFQLGSYPVTWQTKTINGVTINYLGR